MRCAATLRRSRLIQFRAARFGVFTTLGDSWPVLTSSVAEFVWLARLLPAFAFTANRLPPIWRNVARPHASPTSTDERGAPLLASPPDRRCPAEAAPTTHRVTDHRSEATYLFADLLGPIRDHQPPGADPFWPAAVTVPRRRSRGVRGGGRLGVGCRRLLSPEDRDHMQIHVQTPISTRTTSSITLLTTQERQGRAGRQSPPSAAALWRLLHAPLFVLSTAALPCVTWPAAAWSTTRSWR